MNGALRWVALGPVSFQPSEAAKFLLVVYVAHYLARRQDDVRASFMGMVRPLGWLLIPAMLLLAEPDLGATVVIFGASAGAILLAGARLRDMGVLVLIGAGALASRCTPRPIAWRDLNVPRPLGRTVRRRLSIDAGPHRLRAR